MKIKYYFFLFATCIIFSLFAEPPPLPIPDNSSSNSSKVDKQNGDSKTFLDRIKGVFGAKKPPPVNKDKNSQTTPPLPLNNTQPEIEDDKPFIDVGNVKLPAVGKSESNEPPVLEDKNPIPKIQALENNENDKNLNKNLPAPLDSNASAPINNESSKNDSLDIDDIVIPTLPDDEPDDAKDSLNHKLPVSTSPPIMPPLPVSKDVKVEELKDSNANLPNVENVTEDLSSPQNNLNNNKTIPADTTNKETQPAAIGDKEKERPTAINENQQNTQGGLPSEQVKKDTYSEEKKPIINIPDTSLKDKSTSEVPATYPTIVGDEEKNENAPNIEPNAFTDDFKVPELNKIENENDMSQEEPALVKIEDIEPEDPLAGSQEFINNETKMLLLPNDDAVLGITSLETKLEEMDFLSYLAQFKLHYKSPKTQKYLIETEKFIYTYYNLNKNPDILSSSESAAEAFESVRKGDLLGVKAIIDNYNLSQEYGTNGKNLPEAAIAAGNYFMIKYLLIKGFNAPYISDDEMYSTSKISKNIYLLINSVK